MYAMLTLDLEKNISTEKRDKFYEYLKKEKWIKMPNVTTTWYASFEQETTEASIISITKMDVAKAASTSGVNSYNCVVSVGQSKPIAF